MAGSDETGSVPPQAEPPDDQHGPITEPSPRKGRGGGNRSGRASDAEAIERARQLLRYKKVRALIGSEEGRKILDLDDVVFEPKSLTEKEREELQDARAEVGFRRRCGGGILIGISILVLCYLYHLGGVSVDKTRPIEDRKQAEKTMEQVVTGLIAFAVGTVGGYVFRGSMKQP